MGDEILIIAIEVIRGGLLQIDFKNTDTGEQWRCFAEPGEHFRMLGDAMQKNVDQWAQDFENEQIIAGMEEG